MFKQIKTFSDSLAIEDGHITRYVKAETINAGTFSVYSINEEGKELCKNLAYSCYGGYYVHPGHDYWDEPAMNLKMFREEYSNWLQKDDRDKILLVYPEFKWTLEKAGKITLATAMRLLQNWIVNPQTEFLVSAGYKTLMMNKSFLRMGKPKQKAILRYMRENPESKDWNLNKILFAIKKGNIQEYNEWTKFRNRSGKLVEFKWWKKYGPDLNMLDTYMDYIRMCERCGHDTKDTYWKFPKDINAAHEKVQAEYERVLNAERIARDKAREKELRKKERKFKNFASKFLEDIASTDSYTAYIPQDLKTVKEQAKVLHQCLITADYYGEMADRELILVFIRNPQGKPVATAEIQKNGEVGQFYANQKDRNQMEPSKEMQMALDSWLKMYKDKAVTKMKRRAA